MRAVRPLALLSALLAICVAAGGAQSAVTAPTGLHAFLLRADESAETSFSTTPSFAWNPVPGAIHYDFQLSLSNTFRENAIVYDQTDAPTPVVAPPLTLPWISGSPHSLYARVRAITPTGATPWSTGFGFDMSPPPAPTPLQPSFPGLLRWNPVPGASAYQVWLLDPNKMEYTTANTLDERDAYTFHTSSTWIASIRWRIRAIRETSGSSLNGIPAVQYGPWSTTYTSTNPAFATGPITLVDTVSTTVSNGSSSSPAHQLMPAFVWTGNQTLSGQTAPLYRVYVFTDKQCLNPVFTSAVVGSPAYAARAKGPLSLPTTATDLSGASSIYLSDGQEPQGMTFDEEKVSPTEGEAPASETTTVPGAPGETTTGSSSGGAAAFGAPTDLWDTSWPSSGYYWTVIPVQPVSPGGLQTTLVGGAKQGDTTVVVSNGSGIHVGDTLLIGSPPTQETATVVAVNGNQITFANPMKNGHGGGELVVRNGGTLVYQDMELPQDACAAGRVMRFGKESEPALTSSDGIFATGLSSTGRLTSAVHQTKFYGEPLISWSAAVGADEYEVQWSPTRYPFNAQLASDGSPGMMTGSTSVVLPLTPGTWWYRVRGFDYSLPTGSQQMSWSSPARLVVAAPSFSVVGAKPAKPAAKKTTAKKKS
jgi:hypothetical protein